MNQNRFSEAILFVYFCYICATQWMNEKKISNPCSNTATSYSRIDLARTLIRSENIQHALIVRWKDVFQVFRFTVSLFLFCEPVRYFCIFNVNHVRLFSFSFSLHSCIDIVVAHQNYVNEERCTFTKNTSIPTKQRINIGNKTIGKRKTKLQQKRKYTPSNIEHKPVAIPKSDVFFQQAIYFRQV